MNNIFCLGPYQDLIEKFIAQGYKCIPFQEFDQHHQSQLILRHDIDYDTGLALQCAKEENNMGIKASYFFLLRNDFYNVLSPSNYDNIFEIKSLGHEISLHFDPSIYGSEMGELHFEINLFKNLFNVEVNIISLHRPSELYLNKDEPIENVEHTYQSKYFKDIQYCSDSTGRWRYGSPLELQAFKERKNIQLLTHPIWWFQYGETNQDVITRQIEFQKEKLKDLWLANSIPFQNMLHGK